MAVMDVVVPCDCGSKFSFAVEPVNARLPDGAELLCPACGKDGVPLANRVIGEKTRKLEREQLAKEQQENPAAPKKSSWLKRETKPAPATPQADIYSIAAQPARDPFAAARDKDDDVYTGPNKAKGILGAILGGAIGAAVWAATVYFSGYEIRYVAVGVGALAGLGSRVIGGGRDFHLGVIASTCALVAILVGQFAAASIYIDRTISVELAEAEYAARLEQAREAESLRTNEEFKDFIAASRSTIFKPVEAISITPKEVRDFQLTELPKLKEFAEGKPPKAEFIQQERRSFLQRLTINDIFTASITPYLFFWVFIGVGAAWKLASDHGTSVE